MSTTFSTFSSVIRWDGAAPSEKPDELAEEEPLEIRVRGRAVSVTMRTPGHDDELAAGFLLSEGVIHGSADVVRIEPCGRTETGNLVNVVLAPLVPVDFTRLTRHVFAASSCGLCGKASIDAVQRNIPPIADPRLPLVSAEMIAALPAVMRKTQTAFERTGGLHAAALFDESGRLLVLREDVGRHNAVDKALGHALLHNLLPLDRSILLISGRSSFEIMQKALSARVPIVAAVSAPSALAVRFAQAGGQTLIGFLRENRMNVYCWAERVRF